MGNMGRKYGEIWGQTGCFLSFIFARIKITGTVPSVPKLPLAFNNGIISSACLFHSELQAHIVLPLQAYRCLYPLEDGWPGLLAMRRVPRPRFLRAGLGSRLSPLKTRNPESCQLSPNNPAAYADSVFRLPIFLDNGLPLQYTFRVRNYAPTLIGAFLFSGHSGSLALAFVGAGLQPGIFGTSSRNSLCVEFCFSLCCPRALALSIYRHVKNKA
jgi:hypothetical protein